MCLSFNENSIFHISHNSMILICIKQIKYKYKSISSTTNINNNMIEYDNYYCQSKNKNNQFLLSNFIIRK